MSNSRGITIRTSQTEIKLSKNVVALIFFLKMRIENFLCQELANLWLMIYQSKDQQIKEKNDQRPTRVNHTLSKGKNQYQ